MGQAKQRGSLEDRKSNPKGDSWRKVYWTEERLEKFKSGMALKLSEDVGKIKESLFTSRPKKVKRFSKIKTGG